MKIDFLAPVCADGKALLHECDCCDTSAKDDIQVLETTEFREAHDQGDGKLFASDAECSCSDVL